LGVIGIAMPSPPDFPFDPNFGDYKNNPLWVDITQLDHLSPQPGFAYSYNDASGRWEPDLSNKYFRGISGDLDEANWRLDGISGELNQFHTDNFEHLLETNRILTGISVELNQFHTDNFEHLLETNRILTGVSVELNQFRTDNFEHLLETNRILTGVSVELNQFHTDNFEHLLETNRILTGVSVELNQFHTDNFEHLLETNRILTGVSVELDNSNTWLSGISGVLSNEIKIGVDLDHDTESHRLLSGISGVLDNVEIGVDIDADTETHRLLSGVSGQLGLINNQGDTSDLETHKLLSGISGELAELNVEIDISSLTQNLKVERPDTQPWKLVTITVNHKINENFLLKEAPNHRVYGTHSGTTYGTDRDLMDDVHGTYFANARRNVSTPETGHTGLWLLPEDIDLGRGIQSKHSSFHTDSLHAFREEGDYSSIEAQPLKDYAPSLYEKGLVDHVTVFNNSPYPLQIHTPKYPAEPFYLQEDQNTLIHTDDASKIYVKRSHTISGYTVNYSITYKATGKTDVIS
jgi:hypothetical protein